MKDLLERFVGEFIDELADGFVGGVEDVFKWCTYNLSEYNKATAPPNLAMIADVKAN